MSHLLVAYVSSQESVFWLAGYYTRQWNVALLLVGFWGISSMSARGTADTEVNSVSPKMKNKHG